MPVRRTRAFAKWALAITSTVFAAFVLWQGGLDDRRVVVDIYGRTPMNVFFGAVIVGCVILRGTFLERLLSVAPLRFLGRFRYGIYILHMTVLRGVLALHMGIVRLTNATGSLLVGYALFLLIASGGSVLAALCSYFALERRFLTRAGKDEIHR